MRPKGALFAVVLAAAAATCPSAAHATTIEFEATSLGGSLWRYEYFLTEGLFDAQQGFAVLFDPDLYADLIPLPPPTPGWDVLVTVPDVVLDSDGTYDALALVDNPVFAGPFSVSFTWLGLPGIEPGSQPFNVYTLDASGFPQTIEVGVTIPREPVPEPSTLLLAAAGVAECVRRRWKASARPAAGRQGGA